MRWSDQQDVVSSDTLCHFYIGEGLSAEVEKIDVGFGLNPEWHYRLTIGSLFASESVRFPYTQKGMEDLLLTLAKTRNADGSVEPIGGTLEERNNDRTD